MSCGLSRRGKSPKGASRISRGSRGVGQVSGNNKWIFDTAHFTFAVFSFHLLEAVRVNIIKILKRRGKRKKKKKGKKKTVQSNKGGFCPKKKSETGSNWSWVRKCWNLYPPVAK